MSGKERVADVWQGMGPYEVRRDFGCAESRGSALMEVESRGCYYVSSIEWMGSLRVESQGFYYISNIGFIIGGLLFH